MNTEAIHQILKPNLVRWPFQRHINVWLSTLTLLLLGFLLPARGQDPNPDPKYPMSTNASLGATVIFRLIASSTNHPLTFQWQHEGTNLPTATNATLVLRDLAVTNAGGYLAWITNASGDFTNTRTAILTVDTTFTKITTGRVVTDVEGWSAPTWWDYDNDGFLDLYVANAGGPAAVYHNQRDGTFIRVTNNSIAQYGSSIAGAVGDYNNDGYEDLLAVHNGGADDLFRNDGEGKFTRMTKAQVGPPVGDADNSMNAGWADYDRDGFIDLFMANANNAPADDCLYHSNGDGSFTKMTTNQVGLLVRDRAWTGPFGWVDYDNDGWPDLWVGTSDRDLNGRHYLWHNSGDGTFSRAFLGSLTNNIAYGGGHWADYDNDGYQDLFLPSYVGTKSHSLHRNLSGQTFTDVSSEAGVARAMVSWMAAWGDYDNDGFQDLIVLGYRGVDQSILYHNNGNGTFTSIDVGSPVRDGDIRTVPAWADYDNDGFLDLFIACGDGSPMKNLLYHNNGNSNAWLKVKLVGKASNQSAIGAKVRVQATIGGKTIWQMREISGNDGFAGGVGGLVAHFGLGDATLVDLIRIEWPSGNVQEIANSGVNYLRKLTEPININPVRPTASLNGSVTLTNAATGTAYQWLHYGTNLVGQTSKTLKLTSLTAADAGRYSVVVTLSNGSTQTNYAYLNIDTQFTKITQGPVVAESLDTFGGSWVDIDQDGYIDLVVWNGGITGSVQTNGVFRNNQAGGFERLTAAEAGDIVRVTGRWWAGAWGDLDRDGDVDCVALREPPPPMNCFLNDGSGIFTDWKSSDPLVTDAHQGLPALGDYDNDGWLDVSVISAWGGVRTNRLYHGIGGGRFESVTTGPIVTDRFLGTEAQAWSDYDGDGDLDLIVADPGAYPGGSPVFLYRNDGAGQFTRITNGVIPEAKGEFLVPAWADYDNDGKLDLFLSNYDGPSRLFRNEGNGEFTSQTIQTGRESGYPAWGDFDNDGDLDLALATGQTGQFGDQTNLFFLNEGGQLIRTSMGSLTSELGKTSPILWGDYDNDGFLDLFVGRTYNGINSLFHNNGNSNHWVMANLKGTTSNPSAIGAKVRVQATIWGKSVWQLREISGGNRFQGDPRAHFGLGNATNAVTVRIEWPSGTVQELKSVTADQILTVIEPRRPVLAVAVTPTQVTGTLTGDTNQVYELQVSNDLDAGWIALTNVTTDASGKGTWSDPDVAPQGRRFYKAVKTP